MNKKLEDVLELKDYDSQEEPDSIAEAIDKPPPIWKRLLICLGIFQFGAIIVVLSSGGNFSILDSLVPIILPVGLASIFSRLLGRGATAPGMFTELCIASAVTYFSVFIITCLIPNKRAYIRFLTLFILLVIISIIGCQTMGDLAPGQRFM